MLKTKKGFTLIELILYTAILSSILVVMVFITRAMYDARARVRTSVLVRENMRFAMTRISNAIQHADSVTLPTSGEGDVLELAMNESENNPTTFSVSEGRIYLSEGSSGEVAITTDEVDITTLRFERSTTNPPIVRVTISGDKRNAAGPYQAPLTITESSAVRREQ